MSKRNFLKDTLPLHLFVKRQQVLRLFRKLLKSANKINEENLKIDVKNEIKNVFRKHKTVLDNVAIRNSLQFGTRSLAQIDELAGIPKTNSLSSSSWLNNTDKLDERGRVGSGWPWKK